MAMTKKEKAAMDAAIKALKETAALRWTGPVEPDVPVPTGLGLGLVLVKGWSFSAHSMCVYKSCSNGVYHNVGSWDGTTTQNPIRQFSSKLLAAKALRHAMEKDFAYKLAIVDEMIEQERTAPSENPSA